jgi:glycosyltransferase involved in cell wall biosynthesis
MTSATAAPLAAKSTVALVAPPAGDAFMVRYVSALQRAFASFADARVSEASAVRSLGGGTVCVYHLKNDPAFAHVYQTALARPGVVVLHEAVLHNLLAESLPADVFEEEFVYNYGEWLRPLGKQLLEETPSPIRERRRAEFPMLRRLVETSLAVVVHNPLAARLVREALAAAEASTPVFEIPYGVEAPQPMDESSLNAFRQGIGLPHEGIVISAFGPLRPQSRFRSLLEASAKLTFPHRLVLAGEFTSPEHELAGHALFNPPNLVHLPRPSQDDITHLAHLTDIGVSLWHPSTGRTPPEALAWMALGKPVVVTDSEETSAMPSLSVIRVDAGESEVEMLAHYLVALGADESMRVAVGARGREYVEQHHLIDSVAQQYRDVIQRLTQA